MNKRTAVGTIVAAAALVLSGSPLSASPQKPAAAPGAKAERINACSLLTRDEVRKIAPWTPVLDQFKSEEEPIGTTGSACEYPSVRIQVLPFSPGTIEAAKKRGKLEAVAGVGDDAYLYENPAGYAEVYAKIGTRLVTVQKSVRPGDKMEAAKPVAVTLARAVVAKLR